MYAKYCTFCFLDWFVANINFIEEGTQHAIRTNRRCYRLPRLWSVPAIGIWESNDSTLLARTGGTVGGVVLVFASLRIPVLFRRQGGVTV